MRLSQALESNRAVIGDIAARHRVRGVRVFGSVVRGTDTDGSDLDLLVEPTEQTTLLDIGKIQFELSDLLGIDVDVLVVGRVSQISAQAAFKPVARRHKRDINVTVIEREKLEQEIAAGSQFWTGVLSGPTVPLKGVLPHVANA